jgi:serine/threonine protein kinase
MESLSLKQTMYKGRNEWETRNYTSSPPVHTALATSGAQKLNPCEFIIERKISRGVFGEVFVGTSKSGETVALKKICKSKENYRDDLVNREIQAGTLLKHNGIVEFKTFFETSGNVYLVYELLRGRDLYRLMAKRNFAPLEESDVKKIAIQVAVAVLYCHQQGIAHRDLKWDNLIMKKDGTIKLLDFGLCTTQMQAEELCYDFVGSFQFAAPEVMARHPYSGTFSR